MWTCPKCNESCEDTFDACWKCRTSKDGSPPAEDADAEPGTRRQVDCCRCKRPLEYIGTKRFHEGANWGALGGLGELFVKQERFDLYRCPQCGQVELFTGGSEAGTP
jgi:hypothetical protein